MRNLEKFLRSCPIEIKLRFQSFKIPHSVAYCLENVAKQFLKFVEGWLKSELLGDHDDAHLKATGYRLWRNIKEMWYAASRHQSKIFQENQDKN